MTAENAQGPSEETPVDVKANPFPGPGLAHDFDCSHSPCTCLADRVHQAQSAMWNLLQAGRHDPTLRKWIDQAEGGFASLIDHLYYAWTIIANGGHNRGGWESQDPEWVATAERWRDTFHEIIGGPDA